MAEKIVNIQVQTPQYKQPEKVDTIVFQVVPAHIDAFANNSSSSIFLAQDDIKKRIDANQKKLNDLEAEIDRLTNQADKWDYTIAIGSGILAGLIDAIWVGEFNYTELKADSHKHINKFIELYAKLAGYEDTGRGLKGAVEHLEGKFTVDQDNVWKAAGVSSARLHHLEDIAHHPTPLGLLSAIVVKFFRCSVFANKNGEINFVAIDTSCASLAKTWMPILISGILTWMVNVAKTENYKKAGRELPKPICNLLQKLSLAPAIIELLSVAGNWFSHEISDLGGSKQTAGGGMGIPGVFLSLLKEISLLPGIKDTELPKLVNDWYSKGKIDMRAEMAFVEYLGKQSIPIIINECLVRSFYFVRRLIAEYEISGDLKHLNWINVVPWGNRTIARMITISSGCFSVIDLSDAAIRSTLKNGTPKNPKFWYDFIININIVGEGRFVIAVTDDIRMGIKRVRVRNEHIALMNEQLLLFNAHLSYRKAECWYEAKNAGEAISEIELMASGVLNAAYDNIISISKSKDYIVDNIGNVIDDEDIDETSEILMY